MRAALSSSLLPPILMLPFQYKISTEKGCDEVNITLGSKSLVKDASGEIDWTVCEFDAEQGDILTIVYKKDSGRR